MIKKILYVAYKNEYGVESNGLALNYQAWFMGFESLGYEVSAVFYDDHDFESLQKEILNSVSKSDPDMVFLIPQENQISLKTLAELQESKVFSVGFFGDDQWRFQNFSSKYAPYLSACITTDKFKVKAYQEINQKNVILSQWASLESKQNIDVESYNYDVSFVGGFTRYRGWFVKRLSAKGIKVHCFGEGWESGRVTYKEMEKIFLNSKVNLNISNSQSHDIRYIFSSVKALLGFIRNLIKKGKNSSQIKARNFEIPVQGGFQLTDYVPTLEDYFDIGKDLVCYNSVDEVEELIQYYLENSDERESVKKHGVLKSREIHTFCSRIIFFMKKLNKIKGNDID